MVAIQWEGEPSGDETEPDEAMEEDENSGQLAAAYHINTPWIPASGRRLTAASHFKNQVWMAMISDKLLTPF